MLFKTSAMMILFCFLNAGKIQDYRISNFCFSSSSGDEFTVIRTYTQESKQIQLVVDTKTLKSSILPATSHTKQPCKNSRYANLLNRSIQEPHPLQNDGITAVQTGMSITTDLCPSSKKGFEKELYISIIRKFQNPAPVTLFITGEWIKEHSNSFEMLKQWGQDGNLSIIWGNHTYAHPYYHKQPLEKNFALSDDYNLTKDTIELEKTLLSHGVTPSIFFRFPGLVSDKKTMQEIYSLGLIIIGSNTWVAKGQNPKEGSIILLHGNRNEPKGINIFQELLDSGKIQNILPLNDALR